MKPVRSLEEVERFLTAHHGVAVADLGPLSGGYWSSAYSYKAGAEEFVLRVSERSDGFRVDRAAMRFDRPGLPVPAVHHVGAGLGAHVAISRRQHGRFLEDVAPDEAASVGPTIVDLFTALRSVEPVDGEPVEWQHPAASASSWHDWLSAGLVDDPANSVSGWRETLAADAELDTLFERTVERIGELLPACPERRDLVHGDLLHQNVLVADGGDAVTAVFSWKLSVFGDFAFDLAFFTFWNPWHPGIAAVDVVTLVGDSLADEPEALVDLEVRHHCYELHLAATHLGWNAWTGDGETQRRLVVQTEAVLERGPLPLG